MAFTIKPFVIGTFSFFTFCPLMWWNHWFHFLVNHPLIEFLGSIAAVSNHSVKIQPIHQGNGLTNIGCLSSGQAQTHRIAQPIHRDMNLGTEATATTSQRLRFLATTFFGRQQRRDERAQPYYQSSHFPCRGHQRNELTSVPILPDHTSGQSVCRRCSISHIRLVVVAIASRFGLSRARLRQNGDMLLRSFRCTYSGLLSGSPEFSSIVYHLGSQLT